MKIHQNIEKKLKDSLSPIVLEIYNESFKHSVPRDQKHISNYSSKYFIWKKSLVKRHQIIYGLLAYELKNGLHALALNTYTPDEWSSNSSIPESPNCIGGGR